jgi:hypothetical protein
LQVLWSQPKILPWFSLGHSHQDFESSGDSPGLNRPAIGYVPAGREMQDNAKSPGLVENSRET